MSDNPTPTLLEGGANTMRLPEQIGITTVYLLTMFMLAIFPNFLGLGRPLMALVGASIVIFIQGLTIGHELRWEEDVDMDVIYFLFGLMIISHYMELTGFSRVPRSLIDFGARKTANSGPYVLLWIICIVTAVIAMFFTNDMAVYLLTPEIVRLSRVYPSLGKSTHIFLLAVASSANIGAAVSPIGSPQARSYPLFSRSGGPEFSISFFSEECTDPQHQPRCGVWTLLEIPVSANRCGPLAQHPLPQPVDVRR